MKEPTKPLKPITPNKPIAPKKKIVQETKNNTVKIGTYELYSLEELNDFLSKDMGRKEDIRVEFEVESDDGSYSLYANIYLVSEQKDPEYDSKYEWYLTSLSRYETDLKKFELDEAQYKNEIDDYQTKWDEFQLYNAKERVKELERRLNK